MSTCRVLQPFDRERWCLPEHCGYTPFQQHSIVPMGYRIVKIAHARNFVVATRHVRIQRHPLPMSLRGR